MMILQNPTASNCFAEHMSQSDVLKLLDEYIYIQRELESCIESFRWLQGEIQFAMDDISVELEELHVHLNKMSSRLHQFRISQQYKILKEQGELPFD